MPIPDPHRLPLRWRLALGYAFFLLSVIAVVGLFLTLTLEDSLFKESDGALKRRAFHIERNILIPGSDGLTSSVVVEAIARLDPLEEFASPGIYVQVHDANNSLLASSANLPGRALPVPASIVRSAQAGQEIFTTVPAGRERLRVLAQPMVQGEKVIGVVLVAESLHLLDLTLHRIRQLLTFAAAGAILAGMMGGWWLTSKALGPIAEATLVAEEIASTGQFERRLKEPPVRDELGRLAITFNNMLTRLEATFRKQKEFLADASHELRSPLMVIRLNLDLLRIGLPDPVREESAQEALEEVDRMTNLVSDLRFLAEVGAQKTLEHQPVQLDQLVFKTVERAKGLDAGSHQIEIAQNDPTVVLGDQARLEQMLWNLVENSLRYTPTGGKITISLHRQGTITELRVADTGIGIAPEHRQRIFDRFYRVDPARSRAKGGTGLGLAIVKQVVETHGGQVRVRSVPGEGSTFIVVMPIHQDFLTES